MAIYTSLSKHFQRAYRSKAPALLQAARGQIAHDLVIRDAMVLDGLSNKILPGDIWIKSGYIVCIDDKTGHPELVPSSAPMRAEREYNAEGCLVMPGFADGHMHIESTMLTPAHLGELLATKGTTAIFADPHEIVNVAGEEAFRYMIDNSRLSPIRQYFLVPSAVPSVPGLENAGADWDAETIGRMLDLSGDPENRVVGLAEVMQYLDVISGDKRATDITAAARQRLAFMQGHIFNAFSRDLAIYLLEGMLTNHEALTPDEVEHLIRNGMRVDIRLTSSLVSDAAEALVKAIVDVDPSGLMSETCTDDVHVTDIIDHGHINHTVRRLIKYGDNPIVAARRASLSVWQSYGVERAGAIAPGYLADLQIVDAYDINGIGQRPDVVIVGGKIVVEDGELVGTKHLAFPGVEFEARNTVDLRELVEEDFAIRGNGDRVTANVIVAGNVLTELDQIELDICDGNVQWQAANLAAIKVFNRYGLETVGTGLLQNYPLAGGAIASTVSHDSHNLTVVYKDEAAAVMACNALRDCGGGIAYVSPTGELTVLPLPVGGLMSAEKPEAVSEQLQAIEEGYQLDNPGANIMSIVIMALPVVPGYRMSNLGIVDVLNRKLVPLFA